MFDVICDRCGKRVRARNDFDRPPHPRLRATQAALDGSDEAKARYAKALATLKAIEAAALLALNDDPAKA